MNRSEREKRDAEREARRARRLSERAGQRAKRQAEQAEIATRRAEELARKAKRRRSPRDRDLERSIEDYVDDVAEKWSLKAEMWMDDQSRKLSGHSKDWMSSDDGSDMYEEYGGMDDHGFSRDESQDNRYDTEEDYSRSESRRRARRKKRQRRRSKMNSGWKRRNRNGNLYKNTKNKKVCGVCSGVADYWGMETWQVRMMAVFALFIVPSVAVPAYFLTAFLLDDKPYYKEVTDRFHELDEEPVTERRAQEPRQKSARKRKSRQTEAPRVPSAQVLQKAKRKFSDIENRLRVMESHVTSPRFELQRELKKIAGDEA